MLRTSRWPLPAAAGAGLDQQWEADPGRNIEQFLIRKVGFTFGARDDGHTGFLHGGACHGLIAHLGDGMWRWPDEGDALVGAALSEIFALRQKSHSRDEWRPAPDFLATARILSMRKYDSRAGAAPIG